MELWRWASKRLGRAQVSWAPEQLHIERKDSFQMNNILVLLSTCCSILISKLIGRGRFFLKYGLQGLNYVLHLAKLVFFFFVPKITVVFPSSCEPFFLVGRAILVFLYLLFILLLLTLLSILCQSHSLYRSNIKSFWQDS